MQFLERYGRGDVWWAWTGISNLSSSPHKRWRSRVFFETRQDTSKLFWSKIRFIPIYPPNIWARSQYRWSSQEWSGHLSVAQERVSKILARPEDENLLGNLPWNLPWKSLDSRPWCCLKMRNAPHDGHFNREMMINRQILGCTIFRHMHIKYSTINLVKPEWNMGYSQE